MKFSTAAVIGALVAGASALENIQTADQQLNITSPLLNGVYVAGQVIPVSYIPVANNLNLNVYLKSNDAAYPESVIAQNADIIDDPTHNVPVKAGDRTYYQHSINYVIPTTTPSGSYECIFQNTLTNTNTSIPVSILPYVPPANASTTSVATAAVTQPAATETSIILSQPSASA